MGAIGRFAEALWRLLRASLTWLGGIRGEMSTGGSFKWL